MSTVQFTIKKHIRSFMPSKWHESVHEACRNYRDIVKTGFSTVGSHKKLTCHAAKLRARPFDCGLKTPAVQRDRLSVWTPYKGQSPGWLPGPSDLAWPAPSVSVWQRSCSLDDWLVHRLAGKLAVRLAERLHDWLGEWLVGYPGG